MMSFAALTSSPLLPSTQMQNMLPKLVADTLRLVIGLTPPSAKQPQEGAEPTVEATVKQPTVEEFLASGDSLGEFETLIDEQTGFTWSPN